MNTEQTQLREMIQNAIQEGAMEVINKRVPQMLQEAAELSRQSTLAQVRQEVERMEGFSSGMVEEPIYLSRSEVLALLDRLSIQP